MSLQTFHAARALLPTGWANDVAIEVDASGTITHVAAGTTPNPDQTRLSGPVLPGSVNTHSHTFQRAMAGLAEHTAGHDDSFWSWRETMYALVGRLTPEQVETIARYSMIEMLKRGYTALTEFHYLHHGPNGQTYDDPAEMSRRVLSAAQTTGMPITLLPTLYSYADFGGQPATPGQQRFLHDTDAFLALLDTLDAHHGPHATLGMAFHSLRAVTPDQIETVLAARSATGPIHIHVAEQMREVRACQAWSGLRPVAWLFENLDLDARWCLIHATHVDDAERVRLAQSAVTVGLCPTTEASLGDGVFPAAAFIGEGGRFAIGSDSQVCLGPRGELCLLEYGQRLVSQQRNRLHDGGEVGNLIYARAARAGADASGQTTGVIAPGRRADFVVLDERQPMLAGCAAEQITSCWLFSGDDRWIDEVWVAGKRVVADGRHPEEEAAAQAMAKTLSEFANA